MVKVRRIGSDPEDNFLSQTPATYRPHHPHRLQCAHLQDFLAVGITVGDRPQTVGYRPPRQIPPADYLLGNEAFCRSFIFYWLLRSVRSKFWPALLMPMMALCVSFCRGGAAGIGQRSGGALTEGGLLSAARVGDGEAFAGFEVYAGGLHPR